MKRIKNINVILLLLFVLACGPASNEGINSKYNVKYPDFGFFDIKGSNVTPEYLNGHLIRLKHIINGKLYRIDTIIYNNETSFFLPEDAFDSKGHNNERTVRISACISDTSKTFVFKQNGSGYYLTLIESNLGDSSIKVQFLLKTIGYKKMSSNVLDSLSSFNRHVTPYNEFVVIKYYYREQQLYYRTLEGSDTWSAWSPDYYELQHSSGFLYWDLESIEQKESLMYLTKDI
ncbi:hypothetical protein GO495_13455 [Chitinophaga oryziterrae]|uniref:Uncharacterized protein n=2 Tax=Chitinophaga oryziterrae TaxID=1031224 RepID=A0A6N8J901_9BACT|nr:hypothetical protein [Chitinophaga oryziterrae]MVT41593.1 hypothetical protein [Chitinophaga oryziterrae]